MKTRMDENYIKFEIKFHQFSKRETLGKRLQATVSWKANAGWYQNDGRIVLRSATRGTSATRCAISRRVRQRDDNFAIGLCAAIMRVSLLIVQRSPCRPGQVNAPYFALVTRERKRPTRHRRGNALCARIESNRITSHRVTSLEPSSATLIHKSFGILRIFNLVQYLSCQVFNDVF